MPEPSHRTEPQQDAVIVGAGFAGLYLVHRLRAMGLRIRAFESGPDIGGTWFWNRYPGARCDVESLEYAYSFDPELETAWRWTERFATQPEILRYINFVADRLDLRRDITLNTRVTAAHWDQDAALWSVATDSGQVVTCRHLVMATGCLSTPVQPAFPGMERFAGPVLHTGHWPDRPVSFEGRRVAVIGTGSSGVQVIPEVARTAGHLFVFQRTPHFCVPARNAPLSAERIADWHRNFPELRRKAREDTRSGWLPDPPLGRATDFTPEQRQAEYERRWAAGGPSFLYAFSDIGTDPDANATAADFVRAKIRQIVADPATAEALVPTGYPIGAKRITLGSDFYETFNRPNVTLVDCRRHPIAGLTETGVQTEGGEVPVDMVILATGFDAVTGALMRIDIRGRDGQTLADRWRAGPENYLGVAVDGFPNLHLITGPGSPSVLSNVLTSIEQHVDWVAGLIGFLRAQGLASAEPLPQARRDWLDHCDAVARKTLMYQADSWYVGANIPGKPRIFLPYIGGVDAYRRRCADEAAQGFPGFLKLGAPVYDRTDRVSAP